MSSLRTALVVAVFSACAPQQSSSAARVGAGTMVIVEDVEDCRWVDTSRETRRGPSPVAQDRVRPCERAVRGGAWRGCVHVDPSAPVCLNGCSLCDLWVVGGREREYVFRIDQCWSQPQRGCGVAVGLAGDFSDWGNDIGAPDYDCAIVDGRCTPIPLAAAASESSPASDQSSR